MTHLMQREAYQVVVHRLGCGSKRDGPIKWWQCTAWVAGNIVQGSTNDDKHNGTGRRNKHLIFLLVSWYLFDLGFSLIRFCHIKRVTV